MKRVVALALTLLLCMAFTCGCSGGSYSNKNDDSWKSKTWDEMTGKEKQKTYDYIKDLVEDKWY